MAECTCFLLPPEMHFTHYGAVEPASMVAPNPDCPEHFRKPPYRLANGTWSDGVDRTRVIPSHEFSKANPDRVYVHGTWDQDGLGRWKPYFDVWRGDTCIKTGWPFAEAIAYADRMARTNQGENNE